MSGESPDSPGRFTPLARCGGTDVVEDAGGVGGGEGVELAVDAGGDAVGGGEGAGGAERGDGVGGVVGGAAEGESGQGEGFGVERVVVVGVVL